MTSPFAFAGPQSRPCSPPPPSLEDRPEGGVDRGCFVLVVEDDLLVRQAVSAFLSALGCIVRAAASAREAADMCGTLPDQPHVMICDFGLPEGADGLQAIASVRERLGYNLSAYIMTGAVNCDVVNRCRDTGIPLIFKPVSPDMLRSIIERARH